MNPLLTRTQRAPRRILTSVMAVALTVTLAGCSAAFSPEQLPTPQSLRSGWSLTIDFATVVNLPIESKVTINGIESGVVDRITVQKTSAVATLTINPGFVVGKDATVELRQDTLLGDTYVAISNPADAWSNRVTAGGGLGKERVKPPVQIEDLLSSLANFLGSGSLPQLGNTFARVNGQFPADPAEVRRVEGTLLETLNAWADDTQSLNKALVSVTAMTDQLNQMNATVAHLLSPAGVQTIRGAVSGARVADALGEAQRAIAPLLPAVPLINSLTSLLDQVVTPLLIPGWPEYQGQQSNATALLSLLNDKLIPYFKSAPALNIRSLTIQDDVSNQELAGQMVRMFRMLGMVH